MANSTSWGELSPVIWNASEQHSKRSQRLKLYIFVHRAEASWKRLGSAERSRNCTSTPPLPCRPQSTGMQAQRITVRMILRRSAKGLAACAQARAFLSGAGLHRAGDLLFLHGPTIDPDSAPNPDQRLTATCPSSRILEGICAKSECLRATTYKSSACHLLQYKGYPVDSCPTSEGQKLTITS